MKHIANPILGFLNLNAKGNVIPARLIKFKDNYSQIFKTFPGTKELVDEVASN